MSDRTYVNRKEAAQHLRSIGFPISPATLANMASKKKGPPRRVWLGRCYYEKGALERWAASKLREVDGET